MAKQLYQKAVKKLYGKDNWEELPSQETEFTSEAVDIIESGIYENSVNISDISDKVENISAEENLDIDFSSYFI